MLARARVTWCLLLAYLAAVSRGTVMDKFLGKKKNPSALQHLPRSPGTMALATASISPSPAPVSVSDAPEIRFGFQDDGATGWPRQFRAANGAVYSVNLVPLEGREIQAQTPLYTHRQEAVAAQE